MEVLNHEQYMEMLDKYFKKALSSKKKSKEFLVSAGIITEKGNLKKQYRTPVNTK